MSVSAINKIQGILIFFFFAKKTYCTNIKSNGLRARFYSSNSRELPISSNHGNFVAASELNKLFSGNIQRPPLPANVKRIQITVKLCRYCPCHLFAKETIVSNVPLRIRSIFRVIYPADMVQVSSVE